MRFTRRQVVVVGVLALALLAALGAWARHEYWVGPMEARRERMIDLYELYARHFRVHSQTYEALYADDAKLQAESRSMSDWADWYDNRIRFLRSARWFQPGEEKRVHQDFRHKNPAIAGWDEAALRSR